MKKTSPKRCIMFAALLISGAAMVLGLGMGQGDESLAAVFTYQANGDQVDEQGNVWYKAGFDYEGANNGRAKVFQHAPLNRTMVLTKMMSSDPVYPPTCNQACGKLKGSNGQPMKCVDNVSSFPYLGTAGGKLFYPHAGTLLSTWPGHGAHGGNYDIICLGNSQQGHTGACAGTVGDVISTCPQCAKNMSPGESVAPPSTFSDGAIVACAENPAPLFASDSPGAGSGGSNLIDDLEVALDFDRFDARDSSGNGNNGSVFGGVGFTSNGCKRGGCATFDGVNDYIQASDIYSINGDITVMAWVRAGHQGGGALGAARVFDTQRGDGGGLNVYFDSGRFVLDNGGGPSAVVPTPVSVNYTNNNLHHVAAVRTGSTYSIYVNGTLVGSTSGSNPSYTGYTLGRWSISTDFLDGLIDEFYVISRALNQSQIQQIMNDGLSIQIQQAATVAIGPVVESTTVGDAFVVEVGPGETGTSECAKHGKICVGGSLTNRQACLDFYPHALTTNKTEGYASDFKCTGGSAQSVGPCAGTLEDTCALAVSTGDIYECEEPVKAGVDTAFMECENPFEPEVLNETGGFLPPISTPSLDPATGLVPYGVTISHPLNQSTSVTVFYQLVGSVEQTLATLSPVSGSANVSVGTASQSAGDPQIGVSDRVDTDTNDEVTVLFDWNPTADLSDLSGSYVLIVTVTDETGNTTTDISPQFTLDGTIETTELPPSGNPADIDGDGILNEDDPDIDGDGIANVWDDDVDGDGLLNGEDGDDDGDGTVDVLDDSPTGLGTESDIDGDGIPNGSDNDIDGDGLINGVDPDIDGDGIPNGQDPDIDGDGIPNTQDDDMDGDGIPNDQDPDMDGDGLANGEDTDTDGDGIPNSDDPDVDGDGIANGDDPDVDGDGIPNGEDRDVDGDQVDNEIGLDPDPDIDGDGIANVDDPDVDGDGLLNSEDPDVDGDGLLNGEDPDVDGDGIPNEDDGDIDGDGIPNELDGDADGDGVANSEDGDADGDGTANQADTTPTGRETNVGVPDPEAASGLKGSAQNCFEELCDQDQKEVFFEELIEQRQSGALGERFVGVQGNIVDFIVRLYEQGYSLEELTADVLDRKLAIVIAAEVLQLRGNLTEEQIALMTETFYPDVSNITMADKAINKLSELTIVSGFPQDGKFHPEFPTTIVQGAKIIVKTAAVVSVTKVKPVLDAISQEATMFVDWFFPFLKALEELDVRLIADQISGYQDYDRLGLEMDIITFLLLFDKLSEVIGVEDILSFEAGLPVAG